MAAAVSIMLATLVGGELVVRRNDAQIRKMQETTPVNVPANADAPKLWRGPDSAMMPAGPSGELIRYGMALITRTSWYFGPVGSISRKQNGMNCQNCHLKAGREPWANNFGGVASSYPKFKERRGAVESISQRISDCFQRSLNGEAPDSGSKEVRAMIAYIQWLGAGVPKGQKPAGSGIAALPYLERAAEPARGKLIYAVKCQRCHGPEGQGLKDKDGRNYIYPPLWGNHSYNTGASFFRLSRLAGFIRNTMPWGVDYRRTELQDDEAWDLSAFINSQPRPVGHFRQDWPDISLKPVDHPFGPFADGFPSRQHKFGPFLPMVQARTARLQHH
ncbi:c-type cytochrome [Flavitalea sp. BT771]|uniref:c-type cytochrome n=1 Tax=Flavitalea sp. BT771 TaxID=3063329 RepID=UPI0026E43CC9|nr:c-type cytochrome [Flavitalea sp. BT771]MDO6429778.1 c-type cytochrome [Flavitalea sp. BT771]MDV6218094.1 c-type cytochrome [Flavitalea sp. BT771]